MQQTFFCIFTLISIIHAFEVASDSSTTSDLVIVLVYSFTTDIPIAQNYLEYGATYQFNDTLSPYGNFYDGSIAMYLVRAIDGRTWRCRKSPCISFMNDCLQEVSVQYKVRDWAIANGNCTAKYSSDPVFPREYSLILARSGRTRSPSPVKAFYRKVATQVVYYTGSSDEFIYGTVIKLIKIINNFAFLSKYITSVPSWQKPTPTPQKHLNSFRFNTRMEAKIILDGAIVITSPPALQQFSFKQTAEIHLLFGQFSKLILKLYERIPPEERYALYVGTNVVYTGFSVPVPRLDYCFGDPTCYRDVAPLNLSAVDHTLLTLDDAFFPYSILMTTNTTNWDTYIDFKQSIFNVTG